jgi:hypothetical protein
MRIAALTVAGFALATGALGIVSPDSLTAARQHVFDAPTALYAASAIRVTMGTVLILAAPGSRAPRTLRLIGAVMCIRGIVPQVIGHQRGRAILDQEVELGTTALRLGAAVALATGVFVVFAARPSRLPGDV